jgi:hypothetical protein
MAKVKQTGRGGRTRQDQPENLPTCPLHRIDFHFFRTGEVADSLRSAGFEVEENVERDPYPKVEAQTRRAYIFASRLAFVQ